MRTVFIADAHLTHPEDDNYSRLLHFLEELRGTTETLCVMGDLFDFRVGMKQLQFPEHEPVIEALETLSRTGTRIIYLEGNHDFHLGTDFAKRIGAELYRGPVAVNLQGMRLMLCHGDLINRSDFGYRLLHLVMRNRLAASAGHLLPAAVLNRIRRNLQHASKKTYVVKKARWDYRSIIRNYAEKLEQTGDFDGLVIGHFHLAFEEQAGAMQILSLGDWINKFTYGSIEDKKLKLLTY